MWSSYSGKGISMAIRYYCGNCGHEVGLDAKYCSNCGGPIYQPARAPEPETDVGAGTETDVPPPPPPPRAAGGTKPLDVVPEAPHWLRLLVVFFIGALCFGFFRYLGFSSEISFVVAVVLVLLTGREAKRNKRIVRSAPTHSRSIPQWVKIAVATRDGGKCRRCGSAYDLQYDHIIPFSRGGKSDDVNNIQLLCGRCNRLKSNRYVG